AGRLHDVGAAVVHLHAVRRLLRDAARDAREIVPRVDHHVAGGAFVGLLWMLFAVFLLLAPALVGERRNAAVGGILDERRPVVLDNLPVVPEFVVVADVVELPDAAALVRFGSVPALVLIGRVALGPLDELGVGEDFLVFQLGRPLHGNHALVVVHALQIRV